MSNDLAETKEVFFSLLVDLSEMRQDVTYLSHLPCNILHASCPWFHAKLFV